MKFLESALKLSRRGFYVFPLKPNSKLPLLNDYPNKATRDEEKIKTWWNGHNRNIGISTSRFGETDALIAVDVDTKKGGLETFEKLKKEKDFPATFTQTTTTRGLHLVYKTDSPVRQGVDKLGVGLDIRSNGGYLVGAGSMLNGLEYFGDETDVANSPQWLAQACGDVREINLSHLPGTPDRDKAINRAREYLLKEAPTAAEGDGGDLLTYKVAAEIKDRGCGADDCYFLMLHGWNDRCSPPWSDHELREKIRHAYKYGTSPVGIGAPEAIFTELPPVAAGEEILSPYQELNRQYAFVTPKGESIVLDESEEDVEWLSLNSFHNRFASRTVFFEGKTYPLTKIWMKHPERRTYKGVRFDPSGKLKACYYNFWRGFTTSQHEETDDAKDAVWSFKEHLFENIAEKNEEYANWITGWLAHIIQKPEEKPMTALVLRGGKGVGKNVFIDCVARLLGSHAMTVSDKRYLIGNFNSHLETTLLFTLDEAFWSGDKQAEGILKSLITGKNHVIERKGLEPYIAKNYSRIAILGNEDWLVPATQDERRFAVFSVGDGRKQDGKFFRAMIDGMRSGGDRLLLKYLKEFDLSKIDINHAPQTTGLRDQKTKSFGPIEQWVADSLHAGAFKNIGPGGWAVEVPKDDLFRAFKEYTNDRKIFSRLPSDDTFGRMLRRFFPSMETKRVGSDRRRFYYFPALEEARANWDAFIGHQTDWSDQ